MYKGCQVSRLFFLVSNRFNTVYKGKIFIALSQKEALRKHLHLLRDWAWVPTIK